MKARAMRRMWAFCSQGSNCSCRRIDKTCWPTMLGPASGDLRNLIKTVAGLPVSYAGRLAIVVNDQEFDIAARNAIFLIIALVVEDPPLAADTIIHLWYSAFITKKHTDLLTTKVHPLISSVCQKIKAKSETSMQSKLFKFGDRSLRVILKKSKWDTLLLRISTPKNLSKAQAHQIRTSSIFRLENKDNMHCRLFSQQPAHRVCEDSFRKDGVFLPMGWSRENYVVPNPCVLRFSRHPLEAETANQNHSTLFWSNQWQIDAFQYPTEA